MRIFQVIFSSLLIFSISTETMGRVASVTTGLSALMIGASQSDSQVATFVSQHSAGDVSNSEQQACFNGEADVCFEIAERQQADDADAAAHFYSLACEGGHGEACYELGGLMFERRITRDDSELERLSRLGCERGVADSCAAIGYLYAEGIGVRRNQREATHFYRIACDMESAFGCSNLAAQYYRGKGVGRDVDEALRLYRLSCDMGFARACAGAADILMEERKATPAERAEILALIIQACRGGFDAACNSLTPGIFIPDVDLEGAEGLAADLREGCKGGALESCSDLGFLTFHGFGTPVDFDEAIRLYELACDGGIGEACSLIASAYGGGLGVEQDEVTAVAYFEKACDAGHGYGCAALGGAYYEGLGVKRDRFRAKLLFQQACELGERDACGS